jgi:hypothetical protein
MYYKHQYLWYIFLKENTCWYDKQKAQLETNCWKPSDELCKAQLVFFSISCILFHPLIYASLHFTAIQVVLHSTSFLMSPL